ICILFSISPLSTTVRMPPHNTESYLSALLKITVVHMTVEISVYVRVPSRHSCSMSTFHVLSLTFTSFFKNRFLEAISTCTTFIFSLVLDSVLFPRKHKVTRWPSTLPRSGCKTVWRTIWSAVGTGMLPRSLLAYSTFGSVVCASNPFLKLLNLKNLMWHYHIAAHPARACAYH